MIKIAYFAGFLYTFFFLFPIMGKKGKGGEMMFLYEYFTGGVSIDTVASAIATVLIETFGSKIGDYVIIVERVKTCLFTLYDAWMGQVTWATMGSLIVDLATLLIQQIPALKTLSTVISVLWDVSNIL
jgi:hypothetical protein